MLCMPTIAMSRWYVLFRTLHIIYFCLTVQTNGLTERLNQTLSRSLSKLINDDHDDWDQMLETVLFAYRVSKQKSTGFSPFFMMFHRQPSLPIDSELLPSVEYDEPNVDDFIENMTHVRDGIRETASHNISKAQSEQKRYYDSRHSTGVSESDEVHASCIYRKCAVA